MRKFLLKMIWNRRNKVWEILVEQFFIVLVLMLCLGSLFSALKKYNDPGLLNTDNTFVCRLILIRGLLYGNPDA